METKRRRSRVLLKSVQGTGNHRRLEFSESSEMSDSSLISGTGAGVARSAECIVLERQSLENVHKHDLYGAPSTPCLQRPVDTGGVPLIPVSASSPIAASNGNHLSGSTAVPTPSLPLPRPPLDITSSDLPHTYQKPSSSEQARSPISTLPHPLSGIRQSQNKSSCDSFWSTHSMIDESSRHQVLLRHNSSQSEHDIAKHLPSPSQLHSPSPHVEMRPVKSVPTTLPDFLSSSGSDTAISTNPLSPIISTTKSMIENGVSHPHTKVVLSTKVQRGPIGRKSISQPVIFVSSPSKLKKKKHRASPQLIKRIDESSSDSLLKLTEIAKKPPKKKKPQGRNKVHPELPPTRLEEDLSDTESFEDAFPVMKDISPSRSAASRNLSVSSHGPLYTSNLRMREMRLSHETDEVTQLEKFFPDRHIHLYVVTWNMQEKKELPGSLDDLLLPLSQEVAADVFVIGTQESTPCRKDWEVLLQQTLGPLYVLVQSSAIGVIYMSMFIRRDLIWYCSEIRCFKGSLLLAICTASFTTRPVTIIKTKGGVGLSFTLFGSSFLFITSHLAAGKTKVAERNLDMRKIATNLFLREDQSSRFSGDVTSEFDYVFWFGDLNYRVDMDRHTANRYLARKNIMPLLLKDQLTREILLMNAFPGFSEQPITFLPSYKFDMFSDQYDTSEKQRVPSWTDRILFKSRSGGGVVGCGYMCCRSLKCSDHRPVCAAFRVKLEPSHHMEGVPDNIATFDREVYIRAKKHRSTVLAMAKATDEVGGRLSSRRDGRAPVTSQFCTIL